MKQSEAILKYTNEVLEAEGIEFTEGTDVAKVANGDVRKQVTDLVTEGILSEEIDFSDKARAKYDTEAKVRSYVTGLISNWWKKNPKLNGGTTYKPKNPGSRTGNGDKMMKELKKAAKVYADDPTKLASINEFIEERRAELIAQKKKDIEINFDVLPEGLAESLNGTDDE